MLKEIIENIRCSTFHMNDEEAKVIIGEYIWAYPKLLQYHDLEWYYKNC